MPDIGALDSSSGEHSWPVVPTRASRSPRLDTVQEPDNENDTGK